MTCKQKFSKEIDNSKDTPFGGIRNRLAMPADDTEAAFSGR
jgi:hypothetical protein